LLAQNDLNEKNVGMKLYGQQFHAMFLKRAVHTARNWMLGVSQLLVPLIFTIMALLILLIIPGYVDSPPLTLDFSKFSNLVVAYGAGSSPTVDTARLSQAYADQFSTYSSFEPVYVNNESAFSSDGDVNGYLIQATIDTKSRTIAYYNDRYMTALDVQAMSSTINATVFFNNQGLHTIAESLNAFGNALLRYATSRTDVKITTVNHPLPRTSTDEINDLLSQQGVQGFTIALLSVFGMAFLASSFSLFLIKERAVKAKHNQFVSGVHAITFWASTFVWDYINYIIPCIGIIIAFAAFDIVPYVGNGRWGEIFLLYVMFGWGTLPFMYLWSFAFDIPSSGLVWLTVFNILSGTNISYGLVA